MDANDQYFIRGGRILKTKMDRILYILIKEHSASKKERVYTIGRTPGDQVNASEGSLWFECPSSSDVDDFRTIDRTLSLESVEHEDQSLKCRAQDVQRLTVQQFELLVALNDCSERFKVFQDTSWMQEAVSINVGSVVYVMKVPELKADRIPAKVRYKGPLKNKNGIWFGVELSAEHHGKGNTNGNYLGEILFTSSSNCGLLLDIYRIRLCHIGSVFKETVHGTDASTPPGDDYYNDLLPEHLPPNLEIGERVVWISDEGDEHGTVKWIGILPDSRDKEWTVGVEFDKPIGTGTGKYNNRQLFRAKANHASLIPLLGLMKEEAFYSTIPPLPPLEENMYGSNVDMTDGNGIYPEPPPPTPPADEFDATLQNYSFKPRVCKLSNGSSSNLNKNDTQRSGTSTTWGSGSNGTESSDGASSTMRTQSKADSRSQEEILDSLKRPGSGGSSSGGGKFNTSRSRTTTPSSPESHRSATTLLRKGPQGPKPPEKQQKVIEEKSIYDRDPDHPYENVERPLCEEYNSDDSDERFPFNHKAVAKAFIEDPDKIYEPLDTKKKKVPTATLR